MSGSLSESGFSSKMTGLLLNLIVSILTPVIPELFTRVIDSLTKGSVDEVVSTPESCPNESLMYILHVYLMHRLEFLLIV